jgi:hypothetical protein
MEATEVILAYGHENVQATHRTTLEITKTPHLSKEGTCIMAVSADKALADLNPRFKKILQRENAELSILIEVAGIAEFLNASGSPRLVLTHPTDMVIRKSDYACNRTIAIKADKAASDLPKGIVAELKNPGQKVRITLTAMV